MRMKKENPKRSGLWVAALVLLLTACATAHRTRSVTVDIDVESWKGRSLEEVRKVFGRETESEPDGRGGRILGFHEFRGTVTWVPGPTDSPVVSGEERGLPGATPTGLLDLTMARFWIDRNDIVYRYWFAPEVYEKGLAVPPAR